MNSRLDQARRVCGQLEFISTIVNIIQRFREVSVTFDVTARASEKCKDKDGRQQHPETMPTECSARKQIIDDEKFHCESVSRDHEHVCVR